MTDLTPHFSLAELTFTQHRALNNTPPPEIVEHLKIAAHGMEDVRRILGDYGIRVNSGYRSPAINRAVGGVATSAHLSGYAIDFVCPRYGSPRVCAQAIARSGLKFDQLINERDQWVHISFAPTMRQQVLTLAGLAYKPGII